MNPRFQYKRKNPKFTDTLSVFLDGRKAGEIRVMNRTQYYYIPKGKPMRFRGELFNSLQACKNSLEAE